MSGYLLDTNVMSEFSRIGRPDPRVDLWLKTTPNELLFTSVLTMARSGAAPELLVEGKRRTQLRRWHAEMEASFAPRLFPVTKTIADRWAVLSAQSQRNGTPLDNIDGLIAATALDLEHVWRSSLAA